MARITTSPGLQAVHRLLVGVEADELAVGGHVDLGASKPVKRLSGGASDCGVPMRLRFS